MKSVSQGLSNGPSLAIILVQTRVHDFFSNGPSPTSIHPCAYKCPSLCAQESMKFYKYPLCR
jgi:hypothetical protein